MNVPRLTTGRLTLRAHRIEDFPAYAAFMASDRARFMSGDGDGDGKPEPAGQVSPNRHPYFADLELGWLVFDGYEGRGIASEAAAALRGWAQARFPETPIASYIHSGNAASKRLAERLGAVCDQSAVCAYADHVVYRHPAPEARP